MIFRAELAAKVMAGEKTVTRRLCSDNPKSPWWHDRCIYVPGKEFSVQPGRGKPRVGTACVVLCSRMILGKMSSAEAKREGFTSVSAFIAAWSEINGCFDVFARVWRVEFEVLR